MNVFSEVQVGFLPVGHTHSDIDQTFIINSRRLRTHGAITLPDLHGKLSQRYNDKTDVTCMKHFKNWSGLGEQMQCNHKVNKFSLYRFFQFFRSQGSSAVICRVLDSVDNSWQPTHNGTSGNISIFLKSTPYLSRKLAEVLKSPSDKESSNHRRWWKIHLNEKSSTQPNSDSNINRLSESVRKSFYAINIHLYVLHSFVGLKPESNNDSMDLWLGDVVDGHRGQLNIITELTVHCQLYTGANQYTSINEPLTLKNGSRAVPWTDKVHLDAVLI